MSSFDPPFSADLLKDPAAAEAFFKDPKVAAQEFLKHLDALSKAYEQLKGSVTEPQVQSQVYDLADKVAEAKAKLPSLVEEFFKERDARQQGLQEAAQRAMAKVAQARQQVAELREQKEAKIAAAQDRPRPATPELERIGERLRAGVFDRYLGGPEAPGIPPDPGSVADWAMGKQSSRQSALKTSDLPPKSASSTGRPIDEVAREPATDCSSFGSWAGTTSPANSAPEASLVAHHDQGPAPVNSTGHEPSAPQLANTSWSILAGIASDPATPGAVEPPRGMNSWIASGGESMAPPEGTTPAAESTDEARRRFLEWKERLSKNQPDKET